MDNAKRSDEVPGPVGEVSTTWANVVAQGACVLMWSRLLLRYARRKLSVVSWVQGREAGGKSDPTTWGRHSRRRCRIDGVR